MYAVPPAVLASECLTDQAAQDLGAQASRPEYIRSPPASWLDAIKQGIDMRYSTVAFTQSGDKDRA